MTHVADIETLHIIIFIINKRLQDLQRHRNMTHRKQQNTHCSQGHMEHFRE